MRFARYVVAALIAALIASLLTIAGPLGIASAGSVSLASSRTEAFVNQKVIFTGRASAKPKSVVEIQRRAGGKWVTFASTRVRSDKSFRKLFYFERAGVQRIRARVSGAGTSAVLTLKVYRWRDLTDDLIVEGYDFDDAGAQYTNGILTTRTLQSYMSSSFDRPGDFEYADFNLNRKCTNFFALAGLDDDSASDASNRVEVVGDGFEKYSRDFALGQAQRLNLDVSGVLRLRLQTTKLVDNTRVYTNFGNARAKCLY